MYTYYRDVTLFALAMCTLFGLASAGVSNGIVSWLIRILLIFGVFGTGLGVLAFNYFQKEQYYLYYNLGFTKRTLILKTWAVNLTIGVILSGFISFFL